MPVTQTRKKFKLYTISKSIKLVEYLKSREIHFTENNQYPNFVFVNLHVIINSLLYTVLLLEFNSGAKAFINSNSVLYR